MTMQQMGLLAPTTPQLPASIDLRCADIADVLATIEPESVDLVVADPPWNQYDNKPGVVDPGAIYSLLTEEQIGEHMAAAVQTMRRGGRLALWTCWPLLAEVLMAERLPPWLNVPGLVWKSGGSWVKRGRPATGYHWRSASEPVLLGTRKGGAAGRALSMLENGAASQREQHSRKPAPWMADWCRAWVPPGGLVLDLYAGLGSVAEAVALAGEGRRYIGAEIDPKRHATARAMVRRAAPGGAS